MVLQQKIDLVRQIHNRLFAEIVFGKYPPGSLLPAARDIAAEYRAGYCSAVQAVRMLREEGIISCHVGRRAKVLERAPQHYRIGIVLDSAEVCAAPFCYASGSCCWMLHNAVQQLLLKHHIPTVTLTPGCIFPEILGVLDGLILIRHTDDSWNLPLYPEIPAVTIYNQVPPEPWDNSVCIDRRDALTRMAVRFVSCGVRQFWMVANYHRLDWDEPVRKILAEHGIDDCRRFGERSVAGRGIRSRFAAQILPELRLPAGFFASGDFQAKELIARLTAAGLSPRKDFFVIGGTGLPESAHWTPPLSVVATPFWPLAEIAVEMLLRHLQQPRTRLPLYPVPAKLILRKT